MCRLSASTSGALGFQALITMPAWKCASLCLWICAGACQGRCMEIFHLFLIKKLLSLGLASEKKKIILFLCYLGLSKATFQACLLKLQPVFCKSSTLS